MVKPMKLSRIIPMILSLTSVVALAKNESKWLPICIGGFIFPAPKGGHGSDIDTLLAQVEALNGLPDRSQLPSISYAIQEWSEADRERLARELLKHPLSGSGPSAEVPLHAAQQFLLNQAVHPNPIRSTTLPSFCKWRGFFSERCVAIRPSPPPMPPTK